MQPTEMDVCINEKIPFSAELIKTTIHFVFYIILGLQKCNFQIVPENVLKLIFLYVSALTKIHKQITKLSLRMDI